MKRAIQVTSSDQLNFFRLYDGCLMDEIANSWCKFFGSCKEDLHWKKLFPEADPVSEQLKTDLENAAGGLSALSVQLRNYRDTSVSHHDLDESKRARFHPYLEPLRATGWLLYSQIFSKLEAQGGHSSLARPENISGTRLDEIEAHWREISDAARTATLHFADNPGPRERV